MSLLGVIARRKFGLLDRPPECSSPRFFFLTAAASSRCAVCCSVQQQQPSTLVHALNVCYIDRHIHPLIGRPGLSCMLSSAASSSLQHAVASSVLFDPCPSPPPSWHRLRSPSLEEDRYQLYEAPNRALPHKGLSERQPFSLDRDPAAAARHAAAAKHDVRDPGVPVQHR